MVSLDVRESGQRFLYESGSEASLHDPMRFQVRHYSPLVVGEYLNRAIPDHHIYPTGTSGKSNGCIRAMVC